VYEKSGRSISAEIVQGQGDTVGGCGSGQSHRPSRISGDLVTATPPTVASRLDNLAVQHFLSSWGYLALLVLTFAEAACIPIPSEVTLGYAGYLASTGQLAIGPVIVVAVIGELAGSFVGWTIGRFGGRPFVDKFGRYVLVSHSDLDRAESWFRKHGEPAVFFGRILPVIRTFISIPAGIAEMNLVRFGIASLAGSAIWCTAIALAGYELGGEWSKITKGFRAAGYVLVAVGVLVFAVFVLHRFVVLRREKEGLGS